MAARPLFLDPAHHAATCGRDLVILDARAGTYALLAGAGDLVHPASSGQLIVQDRDHAEALLSAGVATHARGPLRDAMPPPPTWSALDHPLSSPGLAESCAMGGAWIEMVGHYYGRSFSHLLQRARSGAPGSAVTTPSPALLRRAWVFDQLSPWTPFQGDCLFRAFMLLRWLQRDAFAPRWVFAVRTWPFYAHCWLQVGDCVLTDFAEPLANLTPIFAL